MTKRWMGFGAAALGGLLVGGQAIAQDSPAGQDPATGGGVPGVDVDVTTPRPAVPSAPATTPTTEPADPSATGQQRSQQDGAMAASPVSERDCRMMGQALSFPNGSAALTEEAKQELARAAEWARSEQNRVVRLEGVSSKSGPASFNLILSEQRANAAKAYLTEVGVNPSQITVVGYGERPPRDELRDQRGVAISMCNAPAAAVAQAETEGDAQGLGDGQGATTEPTPEPAPVVVTPVPVEPAEPIVERTTAPPPRPEGPPSGIGVGLAVGGGAIGFVDEDARDVTDTGGAWEARLTLGTRSFVALEAAYVGSAQSLNALGLDNDALLVGNGGEGNLRINFTRDVPIQPYVFGGIGWTRYDLTNSRVGTSSVRSQDDVYTVPFGVGLAARVARAVFLDVRGTGRYAFDDDMLDGANGSGNTADLSSWNVNGRLGFEF